MSKSGQRICGGRGDENLEDDEPERDLSYFTISELGRTVGVDEPRRPIVGAAPGPGKGHRPAFHPARRRKSQLIEDRRSDIDNRDDAGMTKSNSTPRTPGADRAYAG